MNKKGHGPIDYISKGFGMILGLGLLRFANEGVHMSEFVAALIGVLLIALSILGFFG